MKAFKKFSFLLKNESPERKKTTSCEASSTGLNSVTYKPSPDSYVSVRWESLCPILKMRNEVTEEVAASACDPKPCMHGNGQGERDWSPPSLHCAGMAWCLPPSSCPNRASNVQMSWHFAQTNHFLKSQNSRGRKNPEIVHRQFNQVLS